MKEYPILFQTLMVQAILAKRKRHTRRTRGLNEINKNPDQWVFDGLDIRVGKLFAFFSNKVTNERRAIRSPYGMSGDHLWVRETWKSFIEQKKINDEWCPYEAFHYKADGDPNENSLYDIVQWRPSIHMPRSASRITLENQNIWIERVQQTSNVDAIDEGMVFLPDTWVNKNFPDYFESKMDWISGGRVGKPPLGPSPIDKFEALWGLINGHESWAQNPWVWVVEFNHI